MAMANDEPRTMLAMYGVSGDMEKPLTGLKVGQVPLPPIPEGWVRVKMSAAAINYHDIFTLRGIGWHPVVYPRILGCEGCGTLEDGTKVILYPVMNDPDYMGDETLDPKRHVFHELTDGALAEYIVAPARNVLPLSEDLDPITGSVLGIAWLTAYRMLFTKAAVRAGQTILVQGSSGGVTTALIQLGSAAGVRVWCTGRTSEKRHLAETLGAERTFEPGGALPRKVDAVFDTSGAATWHHSLDSVRAGGSLVTCGGHGGFNLNMDGLRLVVDQISIHGVFAGSLSEFKDLISFVAAKGIKPKIGKVLPLSEGEEGLRLVHEGNTNGKVVLTMGN